MENLLVQLRGERTQTEMAEKYGVSQQSWSCWENGARKPPLNIMLKEFNNQK